MPETVHYTENSRPFRKELVPELIYDANPALVDFYYLAWKQAWEHIYETESLPFSPYIGEGCKRDRIWIWDSCLMGMFCRYAADVYPVCSTLDNLYALRDGRSGYPINIHHLDNPPLFAWTELLLYRQTGDKARLKKILPVLISHYNWLENLDPDRMPYQAERPVWRRERDGYCWAGCPSGMDNTPRGRGRYDAIHWVDAPAQQALSARCIAEIGAIAGDRAAMEHFEREYAEKTALLAKYFDPGTGCFLDRYRDGSGFCRVLTPASFWVLAAHCATKEQAESQIRSLLDPRKLGGDFPFASVAHDDPDFRPEGAYWRGGIWLPVAYMSVKACEEYGRFELAAELAKRLVEMMERTFREFSPHTIWECYSPTTYRPSTNKVNELVRQDFCGWSALGPIALMIENVVGLVRMDAAEQRIEWLPGGSGRMGMKNLPLGGNRISLVLENDRISVDCIQPFRLIFRGRELACPAGRSVIEILLG